MRGLEVRRSIAAKRFLMAMTASMASTYYRSLCLFACQETNRHLRRGSIPALPIPNKPWLVGWRRSPVRV